MMKELIPHAPQIGLYVAPNIPEKKLRHALRDYAPSMPEEDVFALFDATLMGTGGDGAVFAHDRFVFQNHDLQAPQEVRYEDIVRVEKKKSLFKGAKIHLDVNRGHATFALTLDCSGKPDALDYLYRFLHEAMLLPVAPSSAVDAGGQRTAAGSDVNAIREGLDALRERGVLVEADYQRLLDALR